MSSAATPGMGCVLKKGGTPTTVAEVTSIQPTITVGEADVTPLDSTGRMAKFVPTKVDVEVALELNFLPAEGVGDHHDTILEDIQNFDAQDAPQTDVFQIVWNDTGATTWAFTGFFKSFAPSADRDGGLTASAVLRVTGTVDWSV